MPEPFRRHRNQLPRLSGPPHKLASPRLARGCAQPGSALAGSARATFAEDERGKPGHAAARARKQSTRPGKEVTWRSARSGRLLAVIRRSCGNHALGRGRRWRLQPARWRDGSVGDGRQACASRFLLRSRDCLHWLELVCQSVRRPARRDQVGTVPSDLPRPSAAPEGLTPDGRNGGQHRKWVTGGDTERQNRVRYLVRARTSWSRRSSPERRAARATGRSSCDHVPRRVPQPRPRLRKDRRRLPLAAATLLGPHGGHSRPTGRDVRDAVKFPSGFLFDGGCGKGAPPWASLCFGRSGAVGASSRNGRGQARARSPKTNSSGRQFLPSLFLSPSLFPTHDTTLTTSLVQLSNPTTRSTITTLGW